jgi:succinoglycan biosynthesis protein ExoA
MSRPTVAVVIPTLNEELHLARTLESVAAQTYVDVVEIIVADGGSADRTRAIAGEFDKVRIVHNAQRIQASGLNRALAVATADIVVRVDGHCVIADDYIERCVDALEGTGAAMVGGGMHPEPDNERNALLQRGIATAMLSRVGAGPARFHIGGAAGWVDTVYLGAYWREAALAVGGYSPDLPVNEDAEFAVRLKPRGGIWFDPEIRSTYSPRRNVTDLARQFYRYGRGRARTVMLHPREVRMRQLAAPVLVLGLLSSRRRTVAIAYAAVVAGRAAYEASKDPVVAPALALALPVMHLSWGVGFLQGIATDAGARVAPWRSGGTRN